MNRFAIAVMATLVLISAFAGMAMADGYSIKITSDSGNSQVNVTTNTQVNVTTNTVERPKFNFNIEPARRHAKNYKKQTTWSVGLVGGSRTQELPYGVVTESLSHTIFFCRPWGRFAFGFAVGQSGLLITTDTAKEVVTRQDVTPFIGYWSNRPGKNGWAWHIYGGYSQDNKSQNQITIGSNSKSYSANGLATKFGIGVDYLFPVSFGDKDVFLSLTLELTAVSMIVERTRTADGYNIFYESPSIGTQCLGISFWF